MAALREFLAQRMQLPIACDGQILLDAQNQAPGLDAGECQDPDFNFPFALIPLLHH
jgi:hypothetical protein